MNDIVSKDNQISELSHRLELAKNDRRELGSLVRDYTPFIKKCVSAECPNPHTASLQKLFVIDLLQVV